MDFFEKYSSNTLAGSGNQYFFMNTDPEKINIGRLYYKIFSGGKYRYSFLFSNILDSTFANGENGWKNMICDDWDIISLKTGVCKCCGEEFAAEPERFYNLTFDGKTKKHVMPGEFFYTDEIEMEALEAEYICLEIEFKGKMIPYHEESIIPAFLFDGDRWTPSKRMPFPSMVGCDRKVKKKIAFWGDSITQGIGTEVNSYEHWNSKLAEMIGHDYAFWNLGLGYARADDAASGGSWLYKAKQNDVVFVCFGVNDIGMGFNADEIKKNLKKTVLSLKRHGINVILQTIPPFDYVGENIKKHNEINHFIKNNLSEYADMVFDCVPVLSPGNDTPYKAKFGGHPNSEGCEAWAKALYSYLTSNIS